MKDLKLWEIAIDESGEPTVHSVKSVDQTKTEDQLEEMIVRYQVREGPTPYNALLGVKKEDIGAKKTYSWNFKA